MPYDGIWHWGSWSTLVWVMVYCLVVPSHYWTQCWVIDNWTPRNKCLRNFNQNSIWEIKIQWFSFIQESASDNPSQFKSIMHNAICEITAISYRHQCVNSSGAELIITSISALQDTQPWGWRYPRSQQSEAEIWRTLPQAMTHSPLEPGRLPPTTGFASSVNENGIYTCIHVHINGLEQDCGNSSTSALSHSSLVLSHNMYHEHLIFHFLSFFILNNHKRYHLVWKDTDIFRGTDVLTKRFTFADVFTRGHFQQECCLRCRYFILAQWCMVRERERERD